MGNRTPDAILIDCKTGTLHNAGFRPSYDASGLVPEMANEAVPFRLTRNLQHLMTPFGVYGTFANAMASMASCLYEHRAFLSSYLTLFLTDDLLSWHQARRGAQPGVQSGGGGRGSGDGGGSEGGSGGDGGGSGGADYAQRRTELSLRDHVSMNVRRILRRVRTIAPNPELAIASSGSSSSSASGSSGSGGGSGGSGKSQGQRARKAAPVDRQVFALIELAVDPDNLCQMDARWAPWF